MTHTLFQLVRAAVSGYCDIHGSSSQQCGAAKKLGGLAIGALTIVGVASALSKK